MAKVKVNIFVEEEFVKPEDLNKHNVRSSQVDRIVNEVIKRSGEDKEKKPTA